MGCLSNEDTATTPGTCLACLRHGGGLRDRERRAGPFHFSDKTKQLIATDQFEPLTFRKSDRVRCKLPARDDHCALRALIAEYSPQGA
jgi:hypothetical protein